MFSTSTEECIHDLRGHTDLVTGVVLRPSNHLQVQSAHHTSLLTGMERARLKLIRIQVVLARVEEDFSYLC